MRAPEEGEEDDDDFEEVPEKEGYEPHIPDHLRVEYGEFVQVQMTERLPFPTGIPIIQMISRGIWAHSRVKAEMSRRVSRESLCLFEVVDFKEQGLKAEFERRGQMFCYQNSFNGSWGKAGKHKKVVHHKVKHQVSLCKILFFHFDFEVKWDLAIFSWHHFSILLNSCTFNKLQWE